ncbi:MAG: hypothetical protein MJ113_08095 [Lachnospiraceae bacterium]|nr:hypothetical protein [Lachnospiraceae bacterium]
MLGVLYILLCTMVGYVLGNLLIPEFMHITDKSYGGKNINIPSFFVWLPSSYLIGSLLVTWTVYLLAYSFETERYPLKKANIIAFVLWIGVIAIILASKFFLSVKKNKISDKKPFSIRMVKLGRTVIDKNQVGMLVFFIIAFLFVWQLMFRTFSVVDGYYAIGASVASDFAPHMGMIRSFSFGNNFPTQYSHYAGEDIRYHFMFQFMVGNLEFLGMRLDYAFNLPSIFSLAATITLLFVLATKLTGSKWVGYLSSLFFVFRSSFSFFKYIASLRKEEISETLRTSREFLNYSEHEDWGLWNLNVYCNQRHLAFCLALMVLTIIIFLPYLYEMGEKLLKATLKGREMLNEEKELKDNVVNLTYDKVYQSENKVTLVNPVIERQYSKKTEFYGKVDQVISDLASSAQCLFVTKTAFWFKNPLFALFWGIVLGLTAFWNGSVLIATMVVLFFIAAFSDKRLDFLLTAVVALIIGLLESKLFINSEAGSVVSLSYFFGFLADNKTFYGGLKYFVTLTGIMLFALVIAFCYFKGIFRYLVFVFATPVILAFTVKLTPDITVNHKFIMMGLMLLSIFPAALIVEMIKKNKSIMIKALAGLLIIVMTITGFYEYRIVERKNVLEYSYNYKMDDEVTNMIRYNSSSDDIFLTSWYSIHRVVMGGAMLYFGWPYYAWSAGYDTMYREDMVRRLYEAETPEKFLKLCKQENIRYVIVDNEVRTNNSYDVREDVISEACKMVYTTDTGVWRFTVYDTQRGPIWTLPEEVKTKK